MRTLIFSLLMLLKIGLNAQVTTETKIFTTKEGAIKGYKFKGRIDFWNKKTLAEGIASDLKSTSAKTLKAFLRACLEFGYYTQGYIYSELISVSTYIISGVCKSYPAVYTVQMSKTDFATGEKELDRLLENLNYYGIADYFKA